MFRALPRSGGATKLPTVTRTSGLTLTALLTFGLAGALPARADSCPVDGARLASSPRRAWNAGAGVDSDGCTWSIGADGRRWVVGLDVVVCPGCAAVFLDGDVPATLTPAQAKAAREASAAQAPATLQARLERAAEVQRALHPEPADAAAVGALYLRAAWAARQEAVVGGPDGGYRPRSVSEGRRRLDELEERVRRGGDVDPAAVRLDGAAADLDELRRTLAALEPHASGADLVLVARARHLVGAAALGVGEARARLAAGAPLEAGAELVLARGWIRDGDVARRERWLEAALARHGDAVAPEVARVRQACAEEARLLRLARACFEAAAADAPPAERARLLFLAGDGARRAGDIEDAQRLLALVVELEPGGRLASAARALVER